MTMQHQNSTQNNKRPSKISLKDEYHVGHAQHWDILTNAQSTDAKSTDAENRSAQVSNWLQSMLETATLPQGLRTQPPNPKTSPYLLVSGNQTLHINQILKLNDGKPTDLINAFPCVNSPYGIQCKIERMIVNDKQLDAVLRLRADDTIIYAHDQLYAVNADLYQAGVEYFVHLSAWAYQISTSQQNEVILIEDPKAIRYHRAFNDIVAKHNGQVPDDIDEQIRQWQPNGDSEELAPVEINLGHMCAYLFGEVLGQEDEAWCQGQVLGKTDSDFFGIAVSLFDVVILREPDSQPLVVRMATPKTAETDAIAVHDYIQANIWLQAAIYADNQ